MKPHRLSNGKHGGWKPDKPKYGDNGDWHIDKLLGPTRSAAPEMPKLNPAFFPRIKDQKSLGSCTGNSLASCVEYCVLERKANEGQDINSKWWQKWSLSALAAYYFGREKEGMVSVDSGCEIRDVVDACREHGIPTEESWPYVLSKFKQRPAADALKTAPWHRPADIATYRCDGRGGSREDTVTNMLRALEKGLPINYGFACPEDWGDYDNTGLVPLPIKFDGGHAISAYEADTAERVFWGPNSWSDKYGRKVPEGARIKTSAGKGWIGLPFQYFIDGNADDAWAISLK